MKHIYLSVVIIIFLFAPEELSNQFLEIEKHASPLKPRAMGLRATSHHVNGFIIHISRYFWFNQKYREMNTTKWGISKWRISSSPDVQEMVTLNPEPSSVPWLTFAATSLDETL